MEKDVAILLDDDKTVRESFDTLFKDYEINMDLELCQNPEEYETLLNDSNIKSRVKVLIMDLSNTPDEVTSQKYKASEYISNEYNNNRIPIFIHSGNLEHYNGLKEKGTVFKVDKSIDSVASICKDIKLFSDSGFLNLFSKEGHIENIFMDEIYNAFVTQFKNDEIKNIINSIADDSERLTEVFLRIAIRCLYRNKISAKKTEDDGSIYEVKLNSIEHYYRRNMSFLFWTGDVFVSNDSVEMFVILTPRCNIGHDNFTELLVCKIDPISEKLNDIFLNSKKGKENLRKHITDDKLVGERFRFLPPSPQFRGGFVDFTQVESILPENLLSNFSYLISLSNELTNDISRKFASYMLRGGISETNFDEVLYYVSKE